jgi:NTP pyrophosphatase (non-canonical NTP hydrolase)
VEDFGMLEMREMQKELQDKYKDKWESIGPETGKNKLLWMVGEIGEVADIVKKNGEKRVCEEPKIRQDLIEEMADVLMYYNEHKSTSL